jgi:hypothetical protein
MRKPFILFLCALMLVFLQSCIGTIFWAYLLTRPTTDVRPDEIRISKKKTELDTVHGKAVFDKLLQTYQADRWQEVDSYRVELEVEFFTMMGKVFSPFPDNKAHIQLTCVPDSQNVKALFLSGDREGELWQVRNDTVFVFHPDKEEPLINAHGNPVNPINRKRKIEYWLRHFQTIFELPLRLKRYELVSLIDTLEVDDHTYQRLLISWDSAARTKVFDQYVLWINEEGLIELMDFTSRKLSKAVAGRMVIEDLVLQDSIPVPQRVLTKTFKKDKVMYTLKVNDFEVFGSR